MRILERGMHSAKSPLIASFKEVMLLLALVTVVLFASLLLDWFLPNLVKRWHLSVR